MEGLHRQVLPFILRRLKEDVLQDLPPKIIQDYYCDLSPLQVGELVHLSDSLIITGSLISVYDTYIDLGYLCVYSLSIYPQARHTLYNNL